MTAADGAAQLGAALNIGRPGAEPGRRGTLACRARMDLKADAGAHVAVAGKIILALIGQVRSPWMCGTIGRARLSEGLPEAVMHLAVQLGFRVILGAE